MAIKLFVYYIHWLKVIKKVKNSSNVLISSDCPDIRHRDGYSMNLSLLIIFILFVRLLCYLFGCPVHWTQRWRLIRFLYEKIMDMTGGNPQIIQYIDWKWIPATIYGYDWGKPTDNTAYRSNIRPCNYIWIWLGETHK